MVSSSITLIYLTIADLCDNPDFKFSQIEEAYDVFTRAAETKALKVNIEYD